MEIKKISLGFLLIFVLLSCKKDKHNPDVVIIGHAGTGLYGVYPANTLESFRNAFALGVDGVEMDVQMTKDSILVIFHDYTLDDLTNGTGCVWDYTWEELKKIEYDTYPFGRYKIRQVSDLLRLPESNMKIIIWDIKSYSNDEKYLNILNQKVAHLITYYNVQVSRPEKSLHIYQIY
ncbi:MAG: glycerophosphodiester phosphodiesterase family protein [Cytophagaceae bacterium]